MHVIAVVERGRVVELALGLGEVTAVALVSPDHEGVLRAARAAGAIRAVAVWDEALRETDYYGAAQAIACAVRLLGADVIVCGDGLYGLLAPSLADRLGVPHVSGVVAAELRDGLVIASRPAAGRMHLLAAAPPLVLGIAGSGPPPATSDSFEIERLTIGEIGISPAELRWRRRFAPAKPRGVAHSPEARPMRLASADELVARLRAEGLVHGGGAGGAG